MSFSPMRDGSWLDLLGFEKKTGATAPKSFAGVCPFSHQRCVAL